MKKIILIAIMLLSGGNLFAQHEGHNDHNHTDDTVSNQIDTIKMNHDMSNHEMSNHNMSMSHIYSLNLPMSRNGSGTAWMADDTPMYGYMAHEGELMFPFHGKILGRYNSQDVTKEETRGASSIDVPNWFMVMRQRTVESSGLFGFS